MRLTFMDVVGLFCAGLLAVRLCFKEQYGLLIILTVFLLVNYREDIVFSLKNISIPSFTFPKIVQPNFQGLQENLAKRNLGGKTAALTGQVFVGLEKGVVVGGDLAANFFLKHIVAFWLIGSIFGLGISIWFGWELKYSLLFILSSILSLITITKQWKSVEDLFINRGATSAVLWAFLIFLAVAGQMAYNGNSYRLENLDKEALYLYPVILFIAICFGMQGWTRKIKISGK